MLFKWHVFCHYILIKWESEWVPKRYTSDEIQ